MKFRHTVALFGAALVLSSGPAWTDEPGDDDNAKATIRLMSNAEAKLPEAVIRQIKLPVDLVDDEDVVRSARGLLTANTNRLIGNQGIDQAEEAQQRGIEMTEAAQEAQENMGRSDNLPEPPNRP
jgi:hypothetical protein